MVHQSTCFMTNLEQPIPVNEPMPHRKVIREWLVPLSDRVTFGAIVLLLLDYAIWAWVMAGRLSAAHHASRWLLGAAARH